MPDLLEKTSTTQNVSSASQNMGGIPGVSVNARFWYWKDVVSEDTIKIRKAKKLGERLILIFSSFFEALVLILFVYGVVTDIAEDIFLVETWTTPNFYIFLFWISVLGALFLFYRVFDASTKVKTIPVVKVDSMLSVNVLPTLDVVENHTNIGSVTSTDAWNVLEEAYLLAKKGGHIELLPSHIFVSSISSPQIRMMFMRLGIGFDQIKDAIRRHMGAIEKGQTIFGFSAKEIMAQSFLMALEHGRKNITPVEMFAVCYAKDTFLQELLYSVKVEKEELDNVVAWIMIDEQLRERYQQFHRAAGYKATGTMNKSYTSVQTPFLDRVSEDLTLAAVRGYLPMLIGRDREMNELMRAIEGGRQSVVLVGPPGVGKEAIIAGIAERMVAENVPNSLHDKRLVRLSLPHIVSAQGGSGAEERLLYVMQEVGVSGNIVLVIENIDQLVGGFAGGIDLSPILSSELEKGYTFVIATTTSEGYTRAFEQSVLSQKFAKINVDEPDRNEAIRVLESKMSGIENKNKVIFSYPAVAKLVDLSSRYIHETYLPEKAILLAQEAGNMVGKAGKEWQRVTEEHIAELISEKTRVPVTEVTQEEGKKLLDLEDKMHERIIGQTEAVDAIAAALRRARVELRAEGRPIANFLFLGPTGVGKTELAKTTAEVYFGSEDAMLRFDMSEYQDQASISRLIGTQGQGGLLTEAVRKNPFSLVLLDELEKAHPDILNLFLQVMDDGRLTDGLGRTIDFTNVILIATSNAGTQYIQDEVAKGTSLETIKQNLLEEQLRQVYRPEFLNRFDGVMVFKPLTLDDVVAIAYLLLAKVTKRLEAKGITLQASDEAIRELAQKGFDPKFGARPLRRVIQENVDNAVAEFLLQGKVGRRDTLILEPGGKVRVEKAPEL